MLYNLALTYGFWCYVCVSYVTGCTMKWAYPVEFAIEHFELRISPFPSR